VTCKLRKGKHFAEYRFGGNEVTLSILDIVLETKQMIEKNPEKGVKWKRNSMSTFS